MRTCVIFNPAARGERAKKLLRLMQSLASDCACKPTSFAGEARLLASQAVSEGFETIVAAGGDGTLNEVINGIGDAAEGFQKARLGILPTGTINVFARELRIPLALESAWKVILQNRETQVDLPKAEFVCDGKTISRYFAQLAGAGLDSQAVAKVDWQLKKKFGPLAYVVAGLTALRQKQSLITVSGGGITQTGEMALIGNGKLYGGNFNLFSKADLRDGKLEACIFPKVNWNVLIRAGAGMFVNRIPQCCGAKEFSAEAFTMAADQKTFLQLDGENVGELPARFFLEKKRLRVLVGIS